MGVPFFFHTICRRHQGILHNAIPRCDHFYLDFNGGVHQSYHGTSNENEILDKTWAYFEHLRDYVKPQKGTYICLDGVAPRAKMIQQRKRRYLSMLYAKMEERKITWDSNAISPGTLFMTSLNSYLKRKAKEATYPVNVSPADEPGEGEHKIMQQILNIPPSDNVIIYGMDADLIMLSLMTERKHIYLLREIQNPKGYVRKEGDPEFVILDIDALRQGILSLLSCNSNEQNAIESYCIMCFLLGNDFLPNIACLSLQRGDLDSLVDLLRTFLRQEKPLVNVSTRKIQWDNVREFIQTLSQKEEERFSEVNHNYLSKRIYPKTAIEKVDLYPLLSENKHPMAQELATSMNAWRSIYYKTLFHTKLHDMNVVRLACREYLIGIEWVYSYYKQNGRNRHWYYPYAYAPTLKDIANSLIETTNDYTLPPTEFDSPSVQLLAILPLASSELIPEHLRPAMNDIEIGCTHLYPIVYPVCTYLKHHLWECYPILPSIDFELIENTVKELENA